MSFLKKKGYNDSPAPKKIAKEVISKCKSHSKHQRNCVDCEKQ